MRGYCREKELILENLQTRADQPTAEKIFMELKKENPELTLTTVYRNIEELCEEGKIIKIRARSGSDKYDGNMMPHIHLTCQKCGEMHDVYLYELQIKRLDNDIRKMLSEVGCNVTKVVLEVEGICEKCKK